MRTFSAEYEAQEDGITRRPVEIYHAWSTTTGEHWRYTSGDAAVIYGGHTFSPAAISRESTSHNSDFEASKLSVSFALDLRPTSDFLGLTPPENLWIEVFRLYLDQDPYEASVIFIGQVARVSVKGAAAKAECVGLEWFLSQPVPIQRYQPQCNHTLFDARCGKTRGDYETTTTIDSVSADGRTVSATAFGVQADGYYVNGEFLAGNHRRMVVDHVGEVLTLRYPVSSLAAGATVTVWAGCDGNIETCYARFNNVIYFGGFPYIPVDNPATWR